MWFLTWYLTNEFAVQLAFDRLILDAIGDDLEPLFEFIILRLVAYGTA